MRGKLPIVALFLALALSVAGHSAAAGPAASSAPAAGLTAPASPLPWIANDWPRAVSLARARRVPIFVENWAPW